jgi:hypothetical protein
LFLASFKATSEHYRQMLTEVGWMAPPLPDTNLDTGRPTHPADYALADKTYAKLLEKLADERFAGVSSQLKANLLEYYQDPNAPIATKKNPKEWQRVESEIQSLRALNVQPETRVAPAGE